MCDVTGDIRLTCMSRVYKSLYNHNEHIKREESHVKRKKRGQKLGEKQKRSGLKVQDIKKLVWRLQ